MRKLQNAVFIPILTKFDEIFKYIEKYHLNVLLGLPHDYIADINATYGSHTEAVVKVYLKNLQR